MRIGIVINDIATEQPNYTTMRLGMTATNMGHEAWIMDVGDISYHADERIHARGRAASGQNYRNKEAYFAGLTGKSAKVETITVDDLDVLLLRNNPSEDAVRRPWAQSSGVLFGRTAMRHGLIVLNDPNGLSKATNKMYLELFPEEVRPRTVITRDRDLIKQFAQDEGGNIVLKPLQGSGGDGVFLVRPDDMSNLNQMIDAVSRDGYVIAQEYLPAAAEGDTRLFIMNGQPLRHRGKYAAFRRVRTGGDMRSNIHAGGKLRQATVDDVALRLAEMVRPKLVQDGMFLVGLDIVGEKLMEINVFSPGGLGSAQTFEKVNFNAAVVESLERKVQYASYYRRQFDNVDMATL